MYGAEQAVSLWTFVRAVGIGFFIGIIYDIFRQSRQCFFNGKYAVFFQDILFFVIATAITFIFLLNSSYGIIRGYILAGELLGGIIYLCSLGRVSAYFGRILGRKTASIKQKNTHRRAVRGIDFKFNIVKNKKHKKNSKKRHHSEQKY